MKCNWKLQRIQFKQEGNKIILQGDPSLCCLAVSLKAMWRALADQGEGVIVEYGGLQLASLDQHQRVPVSMEGVIKEVPEVFEEPQRLPPSRGKEHAIHLEDGEKPVSVRPF